MSEIIDINLDVDDLGFEDEEMFEDDVEEQPTRTKKNKQPTIPHYNDDTFDEKPNEMTEDEKNELEKLKGYISRIHANFVEKVGKEPEMSKWTLEKAQTHVKNSENKIYNKGGSYIDKLYTGSNMLLEKGGSIILGNMQGLKVMLDSNEQVKDAFKLMVLKRFNGLGYMTPEMKYFSGITMAMVSVYTINQMKAAHEQQQQQPLGEQVIIPQPQQQPTNEASKEPDNNIELLGLPPHIVESIKRNKQEKYKDL